MKTNAEEELREEILADVIKDVRIWFGLVLTAIIVATAAVVYMVALEPGVTTSEPLLGNPRALGMIWGVLAPLAFLVILMIPWTGALRKLIDGKLLRTGCNLLALLGSAYYIVSVCDDVKKVWLYHDQRTGFLVGAAGFLVWTASFKLTYIMKTGDVHAKFYRCFSPPPGRAVPRQVVTPLLYDDQAPRRRVRVSTST